MLPGPGRELGAAGREALRDLPAALADRVGKTTQERRGALGVAGRARLHERERRTVGQGAREVDELLRGRPGAPGRGERPVQDDEMGSEEADRGRLHAGAVEDRVVRRSLRHEVGAFHVAEAPREGGDRLTEGQSVVAVDEEQLHAHPVAPTSHAVRSRRTTSSTSRPATSASSLSRACAGRRAASISSRYSG